MREIYSMALVVENSEISGDRGKSQQRGKSKGIFKLRILQSKNNFEYLFCGKKDHLKKDYWSRKGEGKEGNKNQGKNHEANMAGDIL